REHDVERHPSGAMDERNHSGASHELRLSRNELEPVAVHRVGKDCDVPWFNHSSDVDIGTQARTSPYDRRLRAEEVPLQALLGHHHRDVVEKLSDLPAV